MSRINKWILDDENEVDFEDAEAVNQTDGELNETIVTYEGNTTDVQSWTDFIASFVNGMKIGKFFKNLYAGIQYVLHVGSLVNNCVSDNPELPLAAAQGKVLMDLITSSNDEFSDEITQLKSDLTELNDIEYFSPEYVDSVTVAASTWVKMGRLVMFTVQITYTSSTPNTVGYIPSGYRPIIMFRSAVGHNSTVSNNGNYIYIDSSGTMGIEFSTDSNKQLVFGGMYITA